MWGIRYWTGSIPRTGAVCWRWDANWSGPPPGWPTRTTSSRPESACPGCPWFPGDEPEHGLHWKTTTLTRWAGGRPFIWLDDEIADIDRTWVHRHYPAPALLHRVDSLTGLVDADFTLIRHWLGTVS